jgi:hypothetical protein
VEAQEEREEQEPAGELGGTVQIIGADHVIRLNI